MSKPKKNDDTNSTGSGAQKLGAGLSASSEGARVNAHVQPDQLRPDQQPPRSIKSVLEHLLADRKAQQFTIEGVAGALSLDAENVRACLLGLESEGVVEEVFDVELEAPEQAYRLVVGAEDGRRVVSELLERTDPLPRTDVGPQVAEPVASDFGGAVGPAGQLNIAVDAAAAAAWTEITGFSQPSRGQVQAWLDAVHRQVHQGDHAVGHFGSFEANARFAARLRLVLQGLAELRLLDPKTGLPGMLYHGKAKGSPSGRFLFRVVGPDGKRFSGATSVDLPPLRLEPELGATS